MLTGAKGCAGQSESSHASWDSSLVFSQLSPGTRVLPPGAQRCSARAIAVGRAPHTLAAAESEPLAPGALTRARFPPEGSGAACTAGVRRSPSSGCCQWLQLEPSEGVSSSHRCALAPVALLHHLKQSTSDFTVVFVFFPV